MRSGNTTKPFDVVVVPDFAGPLPAVFEARTLFFLASWLEHAGRARHFPLHLACIGEPPPSVRWLAERCRAAISLHAPVNLGGGHTPNKLRGLEVKGAEDRVLLLDADVVVLSDLSDLAAMGDCISAAPANMARVPDEHWQRIYPALGLDLPVERIPSLASELQGYLGRAGESMLPYYNAGVVFAPWDCGLRCLWEQHQRVILELFRPEEESWGTVAFSDQTGLATAVECLRRRGVPFQRLPHAFHANWLHLYRRTVPLREVKLLHLFRIFRKMTRIEPALPREVRRYRGYLGGRMLREWLEDGHRPVQRVFQYLLPSLGDSHRLGRLLLRLYDRHIGPALRFAAQSSG